MNIIYWKTLTAEEKKSVLTRPSIKNSNELRKKTWDIVNEVKNFGDKAILKFTEQYDKVKIRNILVSEEEFKSARKKVSKEICDNIKCAMRRIEKYQKASFPQSIIVDTNDGIICSRIPKPISTVGLYVPGGSAPLISTLMMLAIPAKLAGCDSIVLCTPPDKNGDINPLLLDTAKRCNITSIYKAGGAQAIAAMAYGTKSVPKVDKIFGPGNEWVTVAKLLVSQDPDGTSIDLPAGPSEVLVIADQFANPEFVASDLLSQVEHGINSQAILITDNEQLTKKVIASVKKQLDELPRKEILSQALNNSLAIIVEKLSDAFDVSNQYAPEHLILNIKNADEFIASVKNAGAVFVGALTPETLGDYVTGSNHVLPTYGFAKSYSGLSISDFMKFISVQRASIDGLKTLGPVAMKLAEIEGLDAHKRAVLTRLNFLEDKK